MRTLTNRIRAFSNENCNKTNLTFQRILKVYLTVVTVVQVHGSVYFFIKSISPFNPRTIEVVASSVLQCGHVVLSATHWHTHGSHPNISVAALGHAHRRAPYVSANFAGEI